MKPQGGLSRIYAELSVWCHNNHNLEKSLNMGLWTFLAIAVIAWALVDVYQYRLKAKALAAKQTESNEIKKLEEKMIRMEKRMGNLEALVIDESRDDALNEGTRPDTDDLYGDADHSRPGKLYNKLK